MRMLLTLGLLISVQAYAAELTVVRGGAGQITLATVETGQYKALIDAGKGARMMSLYDKALGAEIVQKDESGLGGLFEDRPLFSVCEYEGRVVKQKPEEIVLRFAVSKDGINLVKTYTFTEGKPVFGVRYEVENTTQLPFKLWIRNFANPGGGAVTDADHGFMRSGGKVLEVPVPGTYYRDLEAPWAAYVDTEKKSGYFVRCDFDLLDSFYFWNGSRITPTFEWLYKPVPPGQKVATGLVFGLVTGLEKVGSVSVAGVVSAEMGTAEARVEPNFAAIEGWKPLEELYKPTAEEMARGFIPVVGGKKAPAPRLTGLQVDLGLNEREAVPVECFGLAEEAKIDATVWGPGGAAVKPETVLVRVEMDSWLEGGATLKVQRGRSGRLWLTVDSKNLKPGQYDYQVVLSRSGQGEPVRLPLQVTVWNAKLPERPVIGTQLYAYPPTLSSYTLDEAAKKKFLAYVQNIQEMHCDSCDWAVGVHVPAARVTVKGTGELLTEWSKAHPNTAVEKLPDLDFGYFDLWFDEYAKRGMTRFVAHVPAGNGWREAAIIQAALGRKVEDVNSPEAWAVMEWYYKQLRRYAEAKGFDSFWAKVDDEISQEDIPQWLVGAAHYRKAGYKPFTTNTGNIARSATLLREMNKESEAWQVALCLSREFMQLTRQGAVFETRREPVTLNFAQYGNGGAVETWATRQKFFTDDKAEDRVDEVQVFVNGQQVKMRGGSGWGNKDHGVAMHYGGHIYISLPDGGDPNGAKVEVSYRLRTAQAGGEPVVKLEPTDEVWYYGGGGYKTPYEAARAYAWRVCAFGMRGYGWWTYLWHDTENIVVKLDPKTYELKLSPAWEGLRDGNEDGAYFTLAARKLEQAGKTEELKRLLAALDQHLPRGEVKREIYAWDDFIEPTCAGYNAAKREALRVLAN
ncbi:MAG: hypothetical protein ABFD94_17610 [Armatimonadia bacterium]